MRLLRHRRTASAAATVLVLAATALPAAAGVNTVTGVLYEGLGYDIVELPSGGLAPVGFVNPSIAYTLPGSSTGGVAAGAGVGLGSAQLSTGSSIIGPRGIVMTAEGSYALGTLGANSVPGWTPLGFGSSTAQAVNASGLVVGTSTLYSADGTQNFGSRAVYYLPGSSLARQLQLSAGLTDSSGYGQVSVSSVSSSGIIIGTGTLFGSGDASLGNRALRWNASTGAPEVLGSLPGYSPWGENNSFAVSVNRSGTVAGWGNTFTPSGELKAFSAIRWDAGSSTATELGALGTSATGEYSSRAVSVNDSGTIVGHSDRYSASGVYQGEAAVRWAAGSTVATELSGLGSNAAGESFYHAIAINNAGTTIGVADKFDADGNALGKRAVRWAADSTEAVELELLSEGINGESFSYVFGINAAGYSVGSANIASGDSNSMYDVHAVLWDPEGHVLDLNTLLPEGSAWTLYGAYSISDTGWITGLGLYQPEGYSDQYAYTRLFSMQLSLAPVPEPASMALLGLGLFAVLAAARRRRDGR